MKKKLMCLAMIALMVIGTPLTAHAEHFEGEKNWTVSFDGKQMGSNFEAGELKEDALQILPGDSITLQVNLKNDASKKTDWYMSNKVVQTLEESANSAQGGAYTYKLTYFNPEGKEMILFDSSSVGGEEKTGVEEGLLEVNDELEKYFYLDRLNGSEKAYVQLYVQLDGETQGNDYQETLAELQMSFAVEEIDESVIVKKEKKEEVKTQVVTKYVVTTVKTGDSAKIALFSAIALVSGLALFAFAIISMKKNRNQKGE